MMRQVLVPVSDSDPVEELIPCLDEIAERDFKIVFFVRYPVNGLVEWFSDHWITVTSTRNAILAGMQLQRKYSCETQRKLAEARLLPVLQALQERGIEAVVKIYGGDLREAIKGYSYEAGTRLLMRSDDLGNLLKRSMSRIARRLGIQPARSRSMMISILDGPDMLTGSMTQTHSGQ